jgi:hypothetical protein
LLILFCAGEVEELSVKHRIVDDKIREALSKILDIKGSVNYRFYSMLTYELEFCWYVILIQGLKNLIYFDIQVALECFVELDRIIWQRRGEILNQYQLDQREFRLSWEEQGRILSLIKFFLKKQANVSIKHHSLCCVSEF